MVLSNVFSFRFLCRSFPSPSSVFNQVLLGTRVTALSLCQLLQVGQLHLTNHVGLRCWVNWAFTSSLPISVFAMRAFHRYTISLLPDLYIEPFGFATSTGVPLFFIDLTSSVHD